MLWMQRAKQTLLSALNPWREVRELREANQRLREAIGNPLVTGINIGRGSLEMGMEGSGPQLLAGMCLGMLEKYPDTKNYIEFTFGSSKGPLVVTVMVPGGKTPHQLRLEAEQKLAEHMSRHPV